MKLKDTRCPYMYTVKERMKKGNPERDLYQRCSKLNSRCIFAITSKIKIVIPHRKIERCPIRR